MQNDKNDGSGWVIWFVGIPGAGKSTYALAVYKTLQDEGQNVYYLSMDEQRKIYYPNPEYTPQERLKAYEFFAKEAAQIAEKGTNVIMDGTAPQLSMRKYARNIIQRFAEIFIRCPYAIAMYREDNRPAGLVMANLYRKALIRKHTDAQFEGLGEVISVDAPFEEDPMAECVINSDRVSVEQGRDIILTFLNKWGECQYNELTSGCTTPGQALIDKEES